MNTAKYILLCGFVVSSFGMTGCSSVKTSLGLEKESPDEFAVLTRAPLEIPSELTLPPPHPGMPRPQEQPTIKQAQQAVLGDETIKDQPASAFEDAVLQSAGAAQVDPNIRATVNQETAEMDRRNQPVAKKLLALGGADETPSATVVDPIKERERIQKNIEEGKSVTEGKTPYIEE